MPQKLSELRKITNFMRKNGILKYETPEFRISLSRQALKLPSRAKAIEAPVMKSTMPEWNELTLEEQLGWSSTPPGMGGN